jgi:protein-arginine deiminase
VVELPFLFETAYGGALAYQPDSVNLLTADGRVLVPEPFGPVINGVDPFKQVVQERLEGLGLVVFWADDWDLLHRNFGEIHCGTNVARTMDQAWWQGVTP